jgi:hypothetical protein
MNPLKPAKPCISITNIRSLLLDVTIRQKAFFADMENIRSTRKTLADAANIKIDKKGFG